MKIFSTKFHGFLDYLVSAVLLVAPTFLNLDRNSVEGMIFYSMGVTLLFYSLLTNYELGLLKVLPMRFHLALDILSGIFLAASPWIFGFEKQIFIPYVILGVAEIIAGLTTTSQVGVPKMQEILATEVIHPEIVKRKITKAAVKTEAKPSKEKKPAIHKQSDSPKHSVTDASRPKKIIKPTSPKNTKKGDE